MAAAHTDAGANGLRDRPISEVVTGLTRDLTLLARQEVELARSELAAKGKRAVPGVVMIVGAAAAALLAGGALTAFAILVLALFLPEWLAALLVAVALAAVAAVLVKKGRDLVASVGTPVPEQTIETVKEDVAWVKTRARSARR